ncbi:MAG: hypothetical protein MAG453_00390 [Calditrichaeota bacterium]|nr:hypothetical protein [Calditrichota bacterium]
MFLSVAATVAVLFAACSGKEGPPGPSGVNPDNVPPSISLLSPEPGDTLRDTLRVVANAVDNIAVDRVIFYLDGSDRIDDTTFAEVSEQPYAFTFDLIDLNVPDGPHTVTARAFDVDENHTDTPPVIVFSERVVPGGPAVLRAWSPDSLGFFLFPSRGAGDPAPTTDSLYNVRFSPERNCVIDSVRLYLSGNASPGLAYDTTLRVAVHESDGVYPTDTLATTLLDVTGLDSTGWFKAAFFGLPEFAAGERFHVSVSVEQPSDTTLIALGVSIRDRYPFPTDSRSSRFRTDDPYPRWEPLQETYATEEMTREFMIEAWVTYLE